MQCQIDVNFSMNQYLSKIDTLLETNAQLLPPLPPRPPRVSFFLTNKKR